MAWRKVNGNPVIPLRAIGLRYMPTVTTGSETGLTWTCVMCRWQRASSLPVPVKTFVYNHREHEDGPAFDRTPSGILSTPQDRYNEVLRLLKPICNELFDIDDPEEFRWFIDFLLAQFRNTRQRKRVGVVSASEDDSSPRSTSRS
jgi:hypothetical protein